MRVLGLCSPEVGVDLLGMGLSYRDRFGVGRDALKNRLWRAQQRICEYYTAGPVTASVAPNRAQPVRKAVWSVVATIVVWGAATTTIIPRHRVGLSRKLVDRSAKGTKESARPG